ncbi:metal ABC transporter substrate-binding protein [Meiothermus granaticius]|uniref:Putative metal ABC transporter substrate-binding protein Hpf n=1 Tax=Meiothermus granaticius NBRC 107808 TaxID=1227551 RepID=A0A399F959_9DEIN|nr:metal ABC transporter substrate-binding protein [Meiothermus granaticius]RIH92235.1 putative metal ABC transporter substrate-binding protein Hpf [Meiothermus granaticius NBRC 107808]GEM85589.1 ABC transporter substrate-binding protein [Meiothermus granaticius NBRC 107808]
MKPLLTLMVGLGLTVGLAQKGPLPVAATTGFIADMVKNVGGDRIALTVIAPPTADPHSFEPKPSALVGVSKAKVVFGNGLGLEPFFAKIAAQAPQDALKVLLGEGQPGLITTGEGTPDPHLWLDPTYGIRYVERIRDTLIRLDPAGRATYTANAARYIQAIQKADQAVQACLAGIPPSRRKVVSQHEALAYFSRHYGITDVGSIADFAGQEKGPRRFAQLAQAMQRQGVTTVFAEPQFPKNEAKALAEATRAKVALIYSDAFDRTVNTYLKLLEANGAAVCASFK